VRTASLLALCVTALALSVPAAVGQSEGAVLSVTVVGNGHVTSDDGQIDCPDACTATYFRGETVTLTATPDSGSSFAGWSVDCTGTGTCTVTMDQDHNVTATFEPIGHALTVDVNGDGHVTSKPPGIDCPKDCSEEYREGVTVQLHAEASAGWVFAGWGGDCDGTGKCVLLMNENHHVTATFRRRGPTPPPSTPPLSFGLTVSVVGDGSVSSSPGGIFCGGDCSETYPEHTAVTLVPIPGAGSSFVSWGGDCSGSGACSVTMDGPRSVSATFTKQGAAPPENGPLERPIVEQVIVGENLRLTSGFMCYSPEEIFLTHLYQDVLHRPVDKAGLDFFFANLDQGTLAPLDVALALLRSPEYRTMLIQGWYMSFFHRPATPTEIAAGVAMLAGGAADEDVEAAILGSAEFFGGPGAGTNAGFVAALYMDLLGRPPTPAEQAQFDTAFGKGLTRGAAALGILHSTEYRMRLIRSYFQDFLGRPPTDAELAFFLGRLAAGDTDEQIAADILGSNEYFTKDVEYKAMVDWGDGTSGPIAITHRGPQGKTCGFVGVHHYPTLGDRVLKITVTAPDGTMTTFTGLVHVLDHPLPPPGKENVEPFGIVLIKVNGRFVRLRNFRVVSFGTELDTTRGRVKLTSHDGSRGFFYQGRFLLQQALDQVSPGHTRKVAQELLTGGNFGACGSRTTAGVSAKPKRKPIRHLWGNARGAFRTKGKYAAATVRGTLWETIDYCDGTVVIVLRGRVDVFDLVRKKHHIVSAGHRFFSPAP